MTDILTAHEFTVGLVGGGVAFVVLGFALGIERSRPIALRCGGGAFVLGCVAALVQTREVPLGLVVGLALLAGAGLVIDQRRLPLTTSFVACAPGAIVLGASSDLTSSGLVRLIVVVAVAVGGPLVADFDHRYRRGGFASALLPLSVVGLTITVPDTEEALVALGAAAFLFGFAVVMRVALGTPGALASVGLFAWIAAVGGLGREASVIGALGALGVLVVEPLVEWWARTQPAQRRRRVPPRPVLVGLHVAVAGVASRLIGLSDSVSLALVATAMLWFGAGLVVVRLLEEDRGARRPNL